MGLVHAFGQKISNFTSLYLWENSPGICVSRHFRKEERLFRLQKQKVKKNEKLGFFRREQSMFSVKTLKSFHLSIQDKTGQNKVFHDILERKNVYLDNKNTKLKKSKNQKFSKGDNSQVFSKKFEIFRSSYLRQNKPGKCVFQNSAEEICCFRL